VLRRTRLQERGDDTGELVCGDVRLRPEERRAYAGEQEIAFTATEFDLLAYLMGSPGRVYSREQLMRQVWGYDTAAGQRTVDVHVAQVRAKLGRHDVIRTVRGVGYAAETDRAPVRPHR
jgi:DNA-binding response OmpR family regulator